MLSRRALARVGVLALPVRWLFGATPARAITDVHDAWTDDGGVSAEGLMSNNHWPAGSHITVKDYTGPGLDGYLPIIVANWNAALGTGGIKLLYERHEYREGCAGVTQADGTVKVCQFTALDEAPAGETSLRLDGHRIRAAKIFLVADDWTQPGHTAGYWWHPLGCHEMGHALGLNHRFTETDSCMGTQMQTPGSRDVEVLAAQYGGHGGCAADPPEMCCAQVTAVTCP